MITLLVRSIILDLVLFIVLPISTLCPLQMDSKMKKRATFLFGSGILSVPGLSCHTFL
jgi:hypothetical protein